MKFGIVVLYDINNLWEYFKNSKLKKSENAPKGVLKNI